MNKENAVPIPIVGLSLFITLFIPIAVIKLIPRNTTVAIIIGILFLFNIGLSFFLSRNERLAKKKILSIIIEIHIVPYIVLVLIASHIYTLFVIAISFFCYIFLSAILPVIGLCISTFYIELSEYIQIFLLLSLTSILSVFFNKWILKAITRPKIYLKFSRQSSTNLIQQIFSLKSIKYFIYSFHFLFIALYSFNTINNTQYIIPSEYSEIIMYSFLIFLAYDNIHVNSKAILVVFHKILKEIPKAILGDDVEIT